MFREGEAKINNENNIIQTGREVSELSHCKIDGFFIYFMLCFPTRIPQHETWITELAYALEIVYGCKYQALLSAGAIRFKSSYCLLILKRENDNGR